MTNEAVVEAIYLHRKKAGPMELVAEAEARSGFGLEGDKYFQENEGAGPDREITLIASEAIDAFRAETAIPFLPEESRRNVVTRGVALNPLVGREFRVGGATLQGIRLCEPCAHLEKLTRPGVLRGFVGRGGLRARIVQGGTIRVGDSVVVE